VAHADIKTGKKLYWDPKNEVFNNNVEANKLLSRPQRFLYGTNYVVKQKPI